MYIVVVVVVRRLVSRRVLERTFLAGWDRGEG